MEASKQKEWPLLLDAPLSFPSSNCCSNRLERLCSTCDLSKKRREIFQAARAHSSSLTPGPNTFLSIFTSSSSSNAYRFFILFHFLSSSSSFLALDLNQTQYFIPNGNWSLSINTRRERGGRRRRRWCLGMAKSCIFHQAIDFWRLLSLSRKDLQDTRSRRESAGDVTHSHCERAEYSTAQLEARFFFCAHNNRPTPVVLASRVGEEIPLVR